MSHDRIDVTMSDLSDYATRNGTLSDDISGVTDQHLAGHQTVSGTLFGDLGQESGLHDTVRDHLSRMRDHGHHLAGSVRDLGTAVHGAKGDYEANEQLYADNYRRIMD